MYILSYNKSILLVYSYNLNEEQNTISFVNEHPTRDRSLYGYLYLYRSTTTKQYDIYSLELWIDFFKLTTWTVQMNMISHCISLSFSLMNRNIYPSSSIPYSIHLPSSPSIRIYDTFPCTDCTIFFVLSVLPSAFITIKTKYSYGILNIILFID